MNSGVEVYKLIKNYSTKRALNELDLTINHGTVLGLLGPNGSGKTTLIKILAGFIKRYRGKVLIEGMAPGYETKSIVSYLPDKNFLMDHLTIREVINFYQTFFSDFDMEKCKKMLHSMMLNEDMKVATLSKGMEEKLNLTLVFSRNASLYILDEPIAGVDPVARDQILDAIIENITPEKTLLICTHLVRDIERVFDEVAFIDNGKIVKQGNAETLRTESGVSIDELYKQIFGGQR